MVQAYPVAEKLARILRRTKCPRTNCPRGAETENLVWTVIANGTAGGFTLRGRRRSILQVLSEAAEAAETERGNPRTCRPRTACPSETAMSMEENKELGELGFVFTRHPGHAAEITKALIKEAQNSADYFLIITAGGDGTSRDVMSIVFKAPNDVRKRLAVLRLPFGTGNDGADSPDMKTALDLLLRQTIVKEQRALCLTTARGASHLAFNVLSVGLDAFVTMMTSRMKKSLPGDMYKLWVDIASLFYDKIYRVGLMDVAAFDEGKEHKFSERKFCAQVLLMAMGVSGFRTYGQQKRVLPDERNVCLTRQMPLLRKIALKEHFVRGTHKDEPECTLFNAQKIVFSGEYPILAQMDGEAVLLEKADYPAQIELTEPIIPCLSLV